MFGQCIKLYDLEGIEKWDVSNGRNFRSMLFDCDISLDEIKLLEKWNFSNKKYYNDLFKDFLYPKSIVLKNPSSEKAESIESISQNSISVSDGSVLEPPEITSKQIYNFNL
jgi:hypothetical protein